jgi:autotransporter-associated beta strand protein
MKTISKTPHHMIATCRALYLAAIAALLSLSTHSAQAASFTFTGATDSAWETTSNWGGTLPGSVDDAIFSANAVLTSSQTIRRINSQNGFSLTIDSGGDLTLLNSVPLLNNGSSIIINSGGSLTTTRPIDLRSGGGFVTVNDGGSLDAANLRAADGTLAINGSTADVTIGTLRTVDPATGGGNNNNFTANNSNLSLSGATLNITGLMEWDGASAVAIGAGSTLNLAGSGTHIITDGVVTSAGGVLKASGSGTQTLAFDISGDGAIVQDGAGSTTLTGNNTFTGDTTVSQGTLAIGGSGKVGDYTGAITIASGATFEYTSDQASSSTNRFKGGISGDGTFVVNTASGSVLSRAQTVSVANIEIKSGMLNGQANANSLGTAATTIYLGDTSGSADAELRYSGSGGLFTTKAGIIVQAGSTGTKTISTALPTVTDNTNITLNGDLTLAPGQHANNDRSLTLGGVISGAGSLIMDGVANGSGDPGVAILTGANTYTGDTTVNAGILQIGSAGKLDSGGLGFYLGNISVASGAVFQYSSVAGGTAARYFGAISGDGTLIKDTAGNDLRLFGNTSIANIDINLGEIRGANANSLGGAGTTITLGDGGDSGSVRLRYSTSDTFTTKAGIVVAGGAQSKTIANDSGTAVDNTGITLDGSVIVLDNGTLSLGGNISGAGGLTKNGAGTTTLSGTNSYGGATSVTNGTLSLATGYTHSGIGAYTVGTDGTSATLKIADGLNLGTHAMTIGDGGVISPGNSPGTAVTGSQTWNDGGSYLWEINNSGGLKGDDPGWDWLSISGDLTLNSLNPGQFTIDITSLDLSNNAGLAAGFDYSGLAYGDPFAPTFIIATANNITGFEAGDFLLDGSGFVNGKLEWSISLDDGVTDSLVLSAVFVPEPSSTALLGLGGLALMLRRKRS